MGAGLRSPQVGDPTSKFVAEGAAQAAALVQFYLKISCNSTWKFDSKFNFMYEYGALILFGFWSASQYQNERSNIETKQMKRSSYGALILFGFWSASQYRNETDERGEDVTIKGC